MQWTCSQCGKQIEFSDSVMQVICPVCHFRTLVPQAGESLEQPSEAPPLPGPASDQPTMPPAAQQDMEMPMAPPVAAGSVTAPPTASQSYQATIESHDQEDEDYGDPRSWVHKTVASATSMLVHFSLVIIFAFVTCNYTADLESGGQEVTIGELPGETLDEGPSEELDLSNKVEQQDDTQLEEVDPVIDSLEVSPSDEALSLTELSAPGSSAGSYGAIEAVGHGEAGGGGASFMGVRAKGSRFCIIADRSGSMSGPKLEHLKREIIETVSALRGNARFQLIFFNHDADPYPSDEWLRPKQDLESVKTWVKSRTSGGSTHPTPAFEVALKLSPRPEVIFFMTDGAFGEDEVDKINTMNRKGGAKVVIHTISFMDAAAEPLLRKIASASGGTYRHVAGF